MRHNSNDDDKDEPNKATTSPPPVPSPNSFMDGGRKFTEETSPSSTGDFGERRWSSRLEEGTCDGDLDGAEENDREERSPKRLSRFSHEDGEGVETQLEEAPAPAVSTSPSPSQLPRILDPPPSRYELRRDACFELLGGRTHFWIGVAAMLLIIVAGAIFFFMLIGAQSLCRPRTDCEPRNWIYNFSIQLLNVLFTYLATVSLPWRLANAIHLWGWSHRKSDPGLDLYGQPTEEIWFHIPERRRLSMVVLLIGNSLTQYANQTTRIIYHTYELQDAPPGNIWTNVFFVTSMVMAMIAGFWQLYEETALREEHPERFPPSPVQILRQYWQQLRRLRRLKRQQSTLAGGLDDEGAGGQQQEQQLPVQSELALAGHEGSEERRAEAEVIKKGFFRSLAEWFRTDKASLSLWGL
jgi:hypothetical protein